jgi:cardiolipin synthase (CMP-forming)
MRKKDTTDRILTVPNALTLVRFLLVGVMVIEFIRKKPIIAMIVYFTAAATDLLDGYIARRFNQISNVGKAMDPVADKLMTISALVCMFIRHYLTTGVLVVIIVKEALMILGGVLIYFVFKKVVIANLYGKIAAAAYFLAISLLFLHDYVQPVDAYFMYLAVAMNVVSIIQYGYINIVIEYKRRRIEARGSVQ